jgi:glucose-6-phosphate dehydrogenase assembly protein OpcA
MEPDLAALWRDVARDHQVARSVMANLIVFRDRTGARASDFDGLAGSLPIDEVSARHPSRVILLDHDRRQETERAPFAAGIGVVAFGPPGAQYAVEQIAVQSACGEHSLASIVRRLVRGDVPTSLWWTEDLSHAAPIEGILAMARQFVYDSRRWRDVRGGIVALARLRATAPHMDLADTNWRRLTPMRHALLHASTTDPLESLRRGEVRIAHRPGDAALAWLTLGWLSARLGWTRDTAARVDESARSDDVLSMTVGSGSSELTAAMNGERVLVTPRAGIAPFAVGVPQESEAEAVAAELRNLSHDVGLHDAIAALASRFSEG